MSGFLTGFCFKSLTRRIFNNRLRLELEPGIDINLSFVILTNFYYRLRPVMQAYLLSLECIKLCQL